MPRRRVLLLVLVVLLGAAAYLVLTADQPCGGPFAHLGDRLLGRSYVVRCAG